MSLKCGLYLASKQSANKSFGSWLERFRQKTRGKILECSPKHQYWIGYKCRTFNRTHKLENSCVSFWHRVNAFLKQTLWCLRRVCSGSACISLKSYCRAGQLLLQHWKVFPKIISFEQLLRNLSGGLSFFVSLLYFGFKIIISSAPVLFRDSATYDKLFGFGFSTSTALRVLHPACDDWFPKHDLPATDFKLLKFSPLCLDLSPNDDKNCLSNWLLILGDFPWSRDFSLWWAC